MRSTKAWISALSLLCCGALASAAPVAPVNLQVEFLKFPIGIDQPKPRFSWAVEPDWTTTPRGFTPVAYSITVQDSPCSGTPTTVWSSGKVTSNATSNIAYAGSALASATTYKWSVQYWSSTDADPSAAVSSTFSTGMLQSSDWADAAWIAGAGSGNQLITSFNVAGTGGICRATAFVSAPGGFELFINGAAASNSLGVMEWMQFDVTNMYHTLDVTEYVVSGDNAAGLIIGTGVWGHYFEQKPAVKAVIKIVAADGTVTMVNTALPSESAGSDAWLAAPGYITSNDPWVGATSDWRLFESDWSTPAFDPATSKQKWTPVVAAPNVPAGKLESIAMPPAGVIDRIQPESATKLGENHYVYKFPINLVGVVSVSVPATVPSGGSVSLKHGEVLFSNGSVSFPWAENEQTDVHIVSGDVTGLTPRFVWHGFQFVEVVGSDGFTVTGDLGMLTALRIHTDVATTGNVTFSGGQDGEGELLNQIQGITTTAQLNNVAAYMPTDCPTREKHGWAGDALSTAEEAMYNFNMAPVYRRFMKTFVDTQKSTGDVPGAIPNTDFMADVPGVEGSRLTDISWSGAFPQITRWMMLYYGDTASASENWGALTKYVDMLTAAATNNTYGGIAADFIWGDWCATEARSIATPNTGPLLAAFNYILNLDAMAQMADVLGNAADHAKYSSLASQMRPVFFKAFYNQSTGLFGKTPIEVQSCTAAPLALGGVVPSGQEDQLVRLFASHINSTNQGHLTYGSVGAKHVLPTLSAYNNHELAMEIATQTSFPSFGYWISQGATTAWEDWSGIADATHPPPPTHDHIFLAGGIGEWMYRSVAGIAPAANGFNAVRIAPMISRKRGPTAASSSLSTVRGAASVSWDATSANSVSIAATVPAGSTGIVAFPTMGAEASGIVVTEGGNTVWKDGEFVAGTAGVQSAKVAGDAIEFAVTSGAFKFACNC